ncbi:LysR family transcriptional regulator [Paenibacillus algorifonticola]|uniref:LysR family transcriptional regulator n=1 Tax=Paenibacillus algorifonticola TaxID=684063 RepID=UPI003D2D7F1A
MNLEQLMYVVELSKSKSLSEAAAHLHISQSALSQSLTSLEKELGLRLFKRARTGTLPTAEGASIIKKVHEAAKIIEEIRLEAASSLSSLSGELRLSTMPAQMKTMVKVIAWLKKEHPALRIEVSEDGSLNTLGSVREGLADLGMIAMREDKLPIEGLSFHSLCKGKMVALVGAQSPLALRTSMSPEELRQHPFVLYKDDHVDQFIHDFTRQHGPVEVLFRTDYDVAIQSALLEGLAVSIGHDYSFRQNANETIRQFAMLEIEDFFQQPVHFGWVRAKNRPNAPVMDYFINRFEHEYTFK